MTNPRYCLRDIFTCHNVVTFLSVTPIRAMNKSIDNDLATKQEIGRKAGVCTAGSVHRIDDACVCWDAYCSHIQLARLDGSGSALACRTHQPSHSDTDGVKRDHRSGKEAHVQNVGSRCDHCRDNKNCKY
jgi:hypothetical protein